MGTCHSTHPVVPLSHRASEAWCAEAGASTAKKSVQSDPLSSTMTGHDTASEHDAWMDDCGPSQIEPLRIEHFDPMTPFTPVLACGIEQIMKPRPCLPLPSQSMYPQCRGIDCQSEHQATPLKVIGSCKGAQCLVANGFSNIRQVLEKVRSPHIQNLVHAFQSSDHVYLALEHCPGVPLAQVLDTESTGLPEQRVKLICASIASALQSVHAKGCAHGNVSLESVVLQCNGRVTLTRFSSSMTNARTSDKMHDWYCLGVLAFQLLTGSHPCKFVHHWRLFAGFLFVITRGICPTDPQNIQTREWLSSARKVSPATVFLSLPRSTAVREGRK